jgi:hypothetical protein
VIVREEGADLLLVRQADHGLLSGWLAGAWGAPPWTSPVPYEATVVGARLHDLAWVAWDEAVVRREDGRPYAFNEVSRSVATALYRRGVDGVQAIDPYAGLLASLHYSGFYVSHWGWPPLAPRAVEEEREAVAAFLEHERDRQRRLRAGLGLDAGAEHRLSRNYFWLQLWDRISLDVCRRGFEGWEGEYPEAPLGYGEESPAARLRIRLEPGGTCRLDPYPLLPDPGRARVPAVRVPAAACADPAALRRAWLESGAESIEVTFRPG